MTDHKVANNEVYATLLALVLRMPANLTYFDWSTSLHMDAVELVLSNPGV